MPRPSPTSATLSPVLLGTIAGMTAVIAVRLRAGGSGGWRSPGAWRLAALLGALALTVGAFVSPLATLSAHYLLTAHLVQTTVVMGFVPPLLLLGTTGWVPRLHGPAATAARWLTHPAVAIVLVNVVFFGWHASPLYDACLEHEELYSLQVVSLLLVSVAFWSPIVDPTGRHAMGPFFKLGYILLATVPQTFAGLLFALAGRAFYAAYPGGLGLSPLIDQQIAGACMALLSKIALFAAFSVVFLRLFREEGADNETGDDDGGRGRGRDDAPTPVAPPTTPAWLGLLERGRVTDEPAPPSRHPAKTR